MQRIYKFAAVGALMAVLALISTALAVASPRVAFRAGASAGSAKALPNTNIKGKPAHFKPTKLHATARWPKSAPACSSPSMASFYVTNKESKTELVTFTGTDNFTPFSYPVASHVKDYFCITKGYHGTLTGTLKDGKSVKVKF